MCECNGITTCRYHSGQQQTRTAEVCAADLPVGSVVATADTAYIRERKPAPDLMSYPWRGTNGGRFSNQRIDNALADGARVLRVGDGSEEG